MNKTVISYKGYYTRVSYESVDRIFYGKIEEIKDFVNFECSSIEDAEESFKEAVNDYLAFCKEINSPPQKPKNSQFQ